MASKVAVRRLILSIGALEQVTCLWGCWAVHLGNWVVKPSVPKAGMQPKDGTFPEDLGKLPSYEGLVEVKRRLPLISS